MFLHAKFRSFKIILLEAQFHCGDPCILSGFLMERIRIYSKLSLCNLQEYFIRHMDGCTLDTEGEKERVIKCLEAAIQRRVSEVSSNPN